MSKALRWLGAVVVVCGAELVVALIFGGAALAVFTGGTALAVLAGSAALVGFGWLARRRQLSRVAPG